MSNMMIQQARTDAVRRFPSLDVNGQGSSQIRYTPGTSRDEVPQHMRAMVFANQVRGFRAEVKRRVQSGRLSVAEILRDLPRELETMSLEELLSAQHRWAGRAIGRFLTRAAEHGVVVDRTKQLGGAVKSGRPGGLNQRQRDILADLLDEARGVSQ